MPEVFCDYARYYDLIYKDKDYAKEADYVDALIKKFRPEAKTVLSLGCGTGRYDACLAQKGYKVCGLDMSDTMLDAARRLAVPGQLEFLKGDLRTLALSRSFDVVVSLFHVMSYQVSDEDIMAAFRTASRHLSPGGTFVFDFWHGQGVLNDLPQVRQKHLEDEHIKLARRAQPVLDVDRHTVDVHYQIAVLDKRSGHNSELKETHTMRYFFLPEIERYLPQAGLTLKAAYEWMSEKRLESSWYGLIIAGKD